MALQIKRCPRCDQLFMPDKFHPGQKFCSDPDCRQRGRKTYKSEYNRKWKEANPNYFRDYWLEYRELK